MARTRFVGDAGLTVRMTTVMFLLGGLFVALVVALMAIAGGYGGMGFALIVGFIGIGIAIYQWWSSDTVAMKAMRAREVSPQQAPELHAMVDRLCVLADMPKPRVGRREACPACNPENYPNCVCDCPPAPLPPRFRSGDI